ncbi:peptidase S8 [Actinoallomurus liliacearum]|uniref:Peptidase S8 n=1 Tax=Actinoallomurus liliacearum TaxID=1080073 RepID=A0ABP8TGP7_9ACTN
MSSLTLPPRRRLSSALAAALTASGVLAAQPVNAAPAEAHPRLSVVPACGAPTGDRMSCLALVRADVAPQQGMLSAAPAGLGPADLQHAYGLPTAARGSGQTVAIVVAFDNPRAEADLATYRAQYRLPPCTTANGCLRKVDQNGGTRLPAADVGWGEEAALDLDMVSAACPNCRILLVEASEPDMEALGAGVNTAARLGARYISNSYGGREDASTTRYDAAYFTHPGVAITAASGDSGYGTMYPATSPRVTAVGGTALRRSGGPRGWTEVAWSGAGSGCSAFTAKPGRQRDTGCERRTITDVSAVADPATGVAVYDTYGVGGWLVVGGTSASAPIIAAAYALAGTPPADSDPASFPYGRAGALHDVTSGSNGSCTPEYLCTAGPGYDGPTGLGTPNGVTAFQAG